MQNALIILLLLFIGGINMALFIGSLGFFFGAIKGAPFVPTDKKTVQRMIDFAKIQENEKVFDLGCGDGRIVFSAAKKTKNAVGVEISRIVFTIARLRQYFFKEKGTLIRGSLWNIDLRDADVIFLYLLPAMMERFQKEVYPTLKKGVRIISHGFAFPSLTPIETIERKGYQGRVLKYQKGERMDEHFS